MRAHIVLIIAAVSFCHGARAQAAPEKAESMERVRRSILQSQHLGAHGMGYNEQSLRTLSQRLGPSDIPLLIELGKDRELRVGAQFALASQCETAIVPVREAAAEHKMSFLDAEDTLRLMESSDVCRPEIRERAAAMRSEIHTLAEVEQNRLQQETKQREAEDARIQRNAFKMMDPNQAKGLTRQEREEVFRRSLAAMGLKEDGPMTPAQKDLVQKMYRTMVLGEPDKRPPI